MLHVLFFNVLIQRFKLLLSAALQLQLLCFHQVLV